MRISFAPQRRDDALDVSKDGDVLTINGEVFDFSSLPDGATILRGNIPCEWISGHVERIDGELHLRLLLPHGPKPSAAVAFPEPITVTEDGPIAIPHDEEPIPPSPMVRTDEEFAADQKRYLDVVAEAAEALDDGDPVGEWFDDEGEL